ncbi:MAG: hypothetical protein VX641_01130 [Planctomycetota bacterium]|nr:hypothetical protein [Planctomycetota bacterium]
MALRARHDDDSNADRVDLLCDRLLGTGRVRTTVSWLSWISGGALIVVFMTLMVPSLERQRGERTRDSVPQVRIVDAPKWLVMTPELLDQIQTMIAESAGGRADDIGGLREAHAVAEESGWFERVDRLERLPDGSIRVHATMTTPFAVVRWDDQDHLVDHAGCLLDWAFPRGSAGSQLPLLVGTRTAPPTHQDGRPEYGAPWSHAEDVAAGLELARTLQDRPWMSEIQLIDISRYADQRCLWIQCERGPRICWGLSPSVRSAAEITPAEKLRLIDSIHGLYGPLDQITVPEIDVRHDVATMRALADGSSVSSP